MVVAFIPARGGSKSIPLKNIKKFCGKPLIYWNLFALENTSAIDKIIVSTDSDTIRDTVLSFNFKKVTIISRSEITATDTATTECSILEYLSSSQLADDDIFILSQVTSPLTTKEDFELAIEKFTAGKFDSLLSCVRCYRFFWSDDGEPLNYNYMHRPRRQDFSGQLMENGAIYISKVKNIKQSGNRLSGKIGIYEMKEETAFEIDEEHDWIILEQLMYKKQGENFASNKKIKLFISDIDGVLTDGGMYYSEKGDELKKFNAKDGMAFELLKNKGIMTALITSEKTKIAQARADKLKINYLIQNSKNKGKLDSALALCNKLNIDISNVLYVGDDINCKELLEQAGFAFCPSDAVECIKNIKNITVCNKSGGKGVIREIVDTLFL